MKLQQKILRAAGLLKEYKNCSTELERQTVVDKIVINDKILEILKKEVWSKHERDVLVSKAIIRPTGLLDPIIELRPVKNQVDDVLEEVRKTVAKGQRVIITTLTKKFSEELDGYLKGICIRSAYIHSDVETLERLDIISDLRKGIYDVLIGINLLREGIDLPEVSLVAIFDADKEGFLRSKTSFIQIIGRAARHVEGRAILYADRVTGSMQAAIDETNNRRQIQEEHNAKHGIVPQSTNRKTETISDQVRQEQEDEVQLTREGLVEGAESLDDLNLDNRNSRGGRYRDKSGVKNEDRKTPKTAMMFERRFEVQKDGIVEELKRKKYSKKQLTVELQLAVDQQDFARAAAIKDLLES